MKLSLLVFIALGLTMTWQASVVADNNAHDENRPQLTTESIGAPAQISDQRS